MVRWLAFTQKAGSWFKSQLESLLEVCMLSLCLGGISQGVSCPMLPGIGSDKPAYMMVGWFRVVAQHHIVSK